MIAWVIFMCTSVSFGGCFGRNMDIEFGLDSVVTVIPRRFGYGFGEEHGGARRYAVIGMSSVMNGFPLLCDGRNEEGLCGAALSFPDCRYSGSEDALASYQVLPYVLSRCRSIEEVRRLLEGAEISGRAFSGNVPSTPLHWHFADAHGSVAVEVTDGAAHVSDDPADVLTNSPPLEFHLQGLRQYRLLTTAERGVGAVGLPGDFSSVSRFVRAAFLVRNSPEEAPACVQVLRVLENCAMPRGAVTTQDGREELTAYTCCMDGEGYLVRRADETSYLRYRMGEAMLDGTELYFPRGEK